MKLITFEESLARYKQALDESTNAPRSGYAALDELIPGFLPGQLTVLAGATSMGKTCFVSNMAYSMASAQKKRVLFFSLESGHSVAGAINKLSGKTKLPHLKVVVPDSRLTLAEIEQFITANLHHAEIVIVDHLHYLLPEGNDQMQARIGVMVREVQTLAQKLEIPIIVLVHVRKLASETAIPGLNDLKDSSALYQEPSVVLIIHRFKEEVLDVAVGGKQPIFKDNGLLIVSKNRDFGRTGVLKLDFDPEKLAFAVEGQWPWET